jgi:hypothetical protein
MSVVSHRVERMFTRLQAQHRRSRPVTEAALDIAMLRLEVTAVAPGHRARDLVDQIDELERLKASIAAKQARLTLDLHDIRQHEHDERQLRDDPALPRRTPNPDASTGREIGLARRESPYEGRRKLNVARALLHDLPLTLAALERGHLNERRAEIIATETSHLRHELRRQTDRMLHEQYDGTFDGVGNAELRNSTRRLAIKLDEEGYLARRERALSQRHVTTRPLRDGVSQISAIVDSLSVPAIMESLRESADAELADDARSDAEQRTRTQVMADLFVERLGGSLFTRRVPVALKLLVGAETLLGECTEPGYLMGSGFIPASVARRLVAHGVNALTSSIQRLFQAPGDGAIVAMESRSSLYQHSLGEFIALRDRECRTPYCNAPIRHKDHIVSRAQGGKTTDVNGQGLCAGCNYAKESPGWQHQVVPGDLTDPHEVEVRTPTGHRHRSRAPSPPARLEPPTPLELDITRLVLVR